MPRVKELTWPPHRRGLLELGVRRAEEFCRLNGLEMPALKVVPRRDWHFDVCAYYRPTYIAICVEHCAIPCGDTPGRNWSWPGSKTDRTPYGVVCHELGHHMDVTASSQKGRYGGDHSVAMRALSKEQPLTGYCPNDWEWYAEMARLFITNPQLLALLRPVTYQTFIALDWQPVLRPWRWQLGDNCPARVVKSLTNMGAH